ncbi:MAG: class I SAM-dependent methyltransferase [Nitratireductor sp.]|nr:class I SAM-dependent methyltransferase [Nitratireductor sp.]
MMMRTEPDFDAYLRQFEANYEKLNYSGNLSSRVLAHSHVVLESSFSGSDHFGSVVEIGAGSGQHPATVRHTYDRYVITDYNDRMLDQARARYRDDNRFEYSVEDARKLSFEDHSFDRLIATHVLEHLVHPHEVLREWTRVLKPGGTLSLVLPCDPGMAWRLGRALGVRKRAEDAGLEYDYWMAREHVNSIFNLVTFINYYYKDRKATWWPMRVPFADVNLIYAVNIKV